MKTPGPFTIVVIAFNRPHTLARLLRSLQAAQYPSGQETALVVSIDQSDDESVTRLAEEFGWSNGPKHILRHPARLGLREHVIRCGDLTAKWGAIVMLEDDLTVAPGFYEYVRRALEFYGADDAIAGISLYTYRVHPHSYDHRRGCDLQFDPLDDGFDNWFGGFASSWGQAWTPAQWQRFRAWESHRSREAAPSPKLPANVRRWPATSWRRWFDEYLIETGRCFVFPRIALSTNWGDDGTHFRGNTTRYQSPLLCGRRDWRFSQLAESRSVYDAYLEIEPRCLQALSPAVRDVDFAVDLVGLKEPAAVTAPFVLTVRAAKPALKSFGLALYPPELNVVHDVPGNAVRLVRREQWLAARLQPLQLNGAEEPSITARHRPGQVEHARRWRWGPLIKLRRWFKW